ncbi:hypothetical protein TNCV_1053141 [Trichonephila clavipes]|nr:hypothetical protein TNCV_1053141 [Trichonephila clavipes]
MAPQPHKALLWASEACDRIDPHAALNVSIHVCSCRQDTIGNGTRHLRLNVPTQRSSTLIDPGTTAIRMVYSRGVKLAAHDKRLCSPASISAHKYIVQYQNFSEIGKIAAEKWCQV